MTTDRELLELAAKAAGVVVEWREVIRSRIAEFQTIKHTKHCGFYVGGKEWNPLTDDGDALRLAVKLHLLWCVRSPFEEVQIDQEHDALCRDTRRAIVRAAAEIGRNLL